MKRTTMKITAALLAVIMAVTPASTAYAAPGTTVANVVNEAETEEVATGEEMGETETESNCLEETSKSEEESSLEEGTEVGTSAEETTSEEENGSVGETISAEETTEDAVTEEVTSQEETTEEIMTSEENTAEEEHIFPGMGKDYHLSATQKAAKEALQSSMNDFEGMVEGEHYVAGEVVYSTGSAEEAQAVAEAFGGTLASYFDGVAIIRLPKAITVKKAVYASLNSEVNLPPVSPNYYRKEFANVVEMPATDGMIGTFASHGADDPYLDVTSEYYQWQHYAVGSMYAWNMGYTGEGIKVAVIDSGVQAVHPDLKDNVVYHYNAISGTTDNTNDDTSDHGTHVAGIIAADDNFEGGRGIAPDAQVYNLRVFQDDEWESGSAATIARAVNHAVEQGADVINMSLGGVGYSWDEYLAIVNAKESGVAVFAAAGNDGARTLCYPGAFEESICIAATDKGNGKAVFTNYGPWVDLAAPGVDIYSTYPTTVESYTGETGYGCMSGTSMATPVAAGAAAVILSANPKELEGKTGSDKVDALVRLMQNNSTKATGGGMGKGVVNIPKTLGIPGASDKPVKPKFSVMGGTIQAAEITTVISTIPGCELYYSVDGKTPALKNGVVVNAVKADDIFQEITVNGVVNGKATGKVTVKAMAVNKETMIAGPVETVTYTFKPAVEQITVSGATESIPAGKSLSLKATVIPAYAANKEVVWSIDAEKETGVTISKTGVVKTTKKATPGTYTVTALPKDGQGGTPGTYRITVTEAAQIKSLQFSPSKVTLKMGSSEETYDLAQNMTARKVDGSPATAADFIWSSDKPSVAVVDKQTGVVTAVGAGNAVVTVLAADGSGIKKTCTVKVEQLATSITITQPVDTENTENVLLAAGKSVELKANVYPTTTKNKAVTWVISGDSKVTGVSINAKNGKVTASSKAIAGDYTVTAVAKDGSGIIDTITVKVYTGVTKKVTLSKNNVTLFRTQTAYDVPTQTTLYVVTQGSGGYSDEYTVTSSNPNVVSVEKDDRMIFVKATGKATGTSTITVKMNDGSGKKATCKVTVKNPVSKLLIAPEAGRQNVIGKGKSLQLSAVFEEEFGKATKKVNWSVIAGDDTVRVDKNGKVTAQRGTTEEGYLYYAVVQAEVADGSGIKATYDVYTDEAVQSIKLGELQDIGVPGMYYMDVYMNGKLFADSNVHSDIMIEVSDPSKVSVENWYSQIWVYFWDTGTVTLTAKATDGSGKSVKKTFKITEDQIMH